MNFRHGHACVLFIAFCLTGNGCLSSTGYYYPLVSRTPTLWVGSGATEVKAFRVDFTKDKDDRSSMDLPGRQIRFLTVAKDGAVESQIDISPETAGRFNKWEENGLCVRLYRRGFHTDHTTSRGIAERRGRTGLTRSETIEWQPATTLEEQETAIDNVLAGGSFHRKQNLRAALYDVPSYFPDLLNGEVSNEHRQVLLWAADEYQWLAGQVEQESATNVRLIKKANWLRQHAGGEVTLQTPHPRLRASPERRDLLSRFPVIAND